MTRDELITAIRAAGLTVGTNISGVTLVGSPSTPGIAHITLEEMARLADTLIAAEREACAKVCDVKAMHCEMKAQEAIEAGEHDEVTSIRSTAWQISVCAAAIRARGAA